MGNSSYRGIEYRDVTVLESLKHVSMGMERWGFLFFVMSSPIVYFLTTLLAVCPNINPQFFARTFVTSTMRRAISVQRKVKLHLDKRNQNGAASSTSIKANRPVL